MGKGRDDVVPAHVRNTQPRPGIESAYRAAYPAQPRMPPMLLARIGEQLHADADAEERSEEHTSELQSLMRSSYAVFCLKKKNNTYITKTSTVTHTIRKTKRNSNNRSTARKIYNINKKDKTSTYNI